MQKDIIPNNSCHATKNSTESITTINLQEKLNRAQRELSILFEISNAMRTTLELNRILYIILTGVTSHTGLKFNRAILFLINTGEQCLEPKMAIGPESGEHAEKIWNYISESNQHLLDLIAENNIEKNTRKSALYQSVKEFKIPLDESPKNLLSTAFHSGSLLHITKNRIEKEYSQDPFIQLFHTNELIIIPLKTKDRVNGLIIADNYYTQKPITKDDYKIFMMLATQAGLAIENSRLYEETEHRSKTDPITGLWNHGYFQKQLSIEMSSTKKENHPISLIILDIDNFKRLNDTFGHQNGDHILKEIAIIIKDSSRDIDFVCRYGGEEFSIVLTQTNQDQGHFIAERLRQRIENHKFPLLRENQFIDLTVSIGLATFPDKVAGKEELIAKADKAMYKAKFNGKNQTCIAE